MIILIICVGVFALSLYHAGSFGTQAILDSLMFAVALAVAAIPEFDRQGSDIEKHHNDEKVMREVKSILEERSQES